MAFYLRALIVTSALNLKTANQRFCITPRLIIVHHHATLCPTNKSANARQIVSEQTCMDILSLCHALELVYSNPDYSEITMA